MLIRAFVENQIIFGRRSPNWLQTLAAAGAAAAGLSMRKAVKLGFELVVRGPCPGQFEHLPQLLSVEPQAVAIRAGVELDIAILDDHQRLVALWAKHERYSCRNLKVEQRLKYDAGS
jgi:hypothetical protein